MMQAAAAFAVACRALVVTFNELGAETRSNESTEKRSTDKRIRRRLRRRLKLSQR